VKKSKASRMFRLFIEPSSAHYAIIQKLFLNLNRKVKRIRMQRIKITIQIRHLVIQWEVKRLTCANRLSRYPTQFPGWVEGKAKSEPLWGNASM